MLDNYPVVKTLMLWLNPISGIITTARAAILGQGVIDGTILGISAFMSAVYFILGLYYFRNMERYFADIA
jgi:ABC-type polysaccharide/polyol phosphate export permease